MLFWMSQTLAITVMLRQLDWAQGCLPRSLLEPYVRVCLWGYSWKRWAFESVGSVKKFTLTNMGDIILSTGTLARNYRAVILSLELGYLLHTPWDIRAPGPQAFRLQDRYQCSPHTPCSQFCSCELRVVPGHWVWELRCELHQQLLC